MSTPPLAFTRRTDARMVGSEARTPFDNWTVEHTLYRGVFRWLMERLETFSDPAVFVILGPTGVGKTTMIRQLKNELTQRMTGPMADDPALIPYVEAEAEFTPGVGLDWRSLFEDMLDNANEILINAKVEDPLETPGRNLRGLRRAVNNMLLYRSPAVAIVDEGSALLEKGSQSSLAKNINYLKSLGNRSKTHLALFGDYKLADLTGLSGQLNRRCHYAHLPPYPHALSANFHDVVRKFEKQVRLSGLDCELGSSRDMLFRDTCGCVGLLHRWLTDAYVEARRGKTPISNHVLRATAPSIDSLTKWRSEIAHGAAQMAKISAQTNQIFEP